MGSIKQQYFVLDIFNLCLAQKRLDYWNLSFFVVHVYLPGAVHDVGEIYGESHNTQNSGCDQTVSRTWKL